MKSDRRAFLAILASLTTISSWRIGWGKTPFRDTHDTTPSAATTPDDPLCRESSNPPEKWPHSWSGLPRLPLLRNHLKLLGETRTVEWFIASLSLERSLSGKSLDFFYHGGSEPGTWRNVLPVLLFTVPADLNAPDLTREPVYLLAHCLKRRSVRTFRLDRISL